MQFSWSHQVWRHPDDGDVSAIGFRSMQRFRRIPVYAEIALGKIMRSIVHPRLASGYKAEPALIDVISNDAVDTVSAEPRGA